MELMGTLTWLTFVVTAFFAGRHLGRLAGRREMLEDATRRVYEMRERAMAMLRRCRVRYSDEELTGAPATTESEKTREDIVMGLT